MAQLGSTGNQAVYTWDGENRLIAVAPAAGAEVEGAKKAAFAYDYLGRRIAKQVWTYTSGDWVLTQHRRFVWSGWLMLVEFDVLGDCGMLPYDSSCVVRQYTWGLDLAGQNAQGNSLEAAGGIGGLLAISDPNDLTDGSDLYGDFVVLYDGNGNVGQLVNWSAGSASASLVAKYEYDPYGGLFATSGSYATENPVRFSTKYFDTETGLGYWGYRYYSPTQGRWVSRDPIEESGGLALYVFAQNQAVGLCDPLGLKLDSPSVAVATGQMTAAEVAELLGIDLATAQTAVSLGTVATLVLWRQQIFDRIKEFTEKMNEVLERIKKLCCPCPYYYGYRVVTAWFWINTPEQDWKTVTFRDHMAAAKDEQRVGATRHTAKINADRKRVGLPPIPVSSHYREVIAYCKRLKNGLRSLKVCIDDARAAGSTACSYSKDYSPFDAFTKITQNECTKLERRPPPP